MSTKRWLTLLVLLAATAVAFAASQGESPAAKPEGPVTLTAFWTLDSKTGMTMKSYAEMTVFKEMEKKTGVRIDFKHPPSGQEREQFNLMLASNALTDIIYWNWFSVPGGPGKAIADKQILRLNELMDKHAPAYLAHLKEYPERRKMVTLDDGTHYMFPKFKHDKYVLISHGFQAREDWVKKLGLKTPKSIDEWHAFLTAMKKGDPNGNGKPDEIPFVGYALEHYSLVRFSWAFGVFIDFVMDGNRIKYGPMEPGWKQYLETMRKWYAEGLIDPDFASTDSKGFEAKIVGDRAAAYAGLINGHMGRFYGLKKNDPNFALVGIQPPTGPAGKPYGYFNWPPTGGGIAISTTSKDPVAATRWSDYIFTKEGVILTNYGVEGLTYAIKDGKIEFTDLITNNPDKLPMINALSQHVWSAHDGPGLQLEKTFRDIQLKPQQDAVTTYHTTTDDSLLVPPAQPTPAEGEKLSAIMNDISTYVEEMHNKFIMGQVPMSEWDSYVATMKKMGVDDAVRMWQAIIDRYNAK
jgi:putative aldouronate transport system substrate-binding protein